MFQPTYRVLKVVLKAGLILIVGLAIWVLAGTVWSAIQPHHAVPVTEHAGLTIQQVRALASLVTTRVTLVDVITTEIAGVGGSMSAILVIRGDAEIAFDLEQARFTQIDLPGRQATLALPPPKVVQARVDHEHTTLRGVQRHGLWMLMRLDGVHQQLVDSGLREAQQAIEKGANDQAIMATARQHARQVLEAFANSAGWQLTIRWDVPPEKP